MGYNWTLYVCRWYFLSNWHATCVPVTQKNYPIAYSESIHVPLLIALCCAVVRVFMCALCQPNFQPIDSEYRMEIGAWVITQSHHEFILNLVMWLCQSRNSHTWKWLVTTVDVSSASWMVPIVWRVSGREGVQIMYPFWWPVAFIEQYPVPLCLVNYNIWMYAEVPIQTHWLLMFFYIAWWYLFSFMSTCIFCSYSISQLIKRSNCTTVWTEDILYAF